MSEEEKRKVFKYVPEIAEKSAELLEKIKTKSHLENLKKPEAQKVNLFDIKEELTQPIDYSDLPDHLFVRSKDGTMLLNDPQSDLQKKAGKQMISQVAKKLLKADLTGITMPIFMFDNDTYLHKIAKGMSFMPDLMREAAEEGDKLKQLKLVIRMYLASTNNQLSHKQPINPVLGETHSCIVGDC